MLTGKMAFSGETVTDTLAAVIKEEPDWSQLPAALSVRVRVLLQRCLQKDLKQRLQAIGDARISLDEVLSGAPETAPIPAIRAVSKGPRWLWLVGGVAALLIVAAFAGFAGWTLKPPPAKPVMRFTITLPPGQRLAELNRPALAVSPDGSELAYVATTQGGGTQQIYLRAMDSTETRPIPGTEGANNLFFSPDGQWLGFVAGAKLKKISVNGGVAQILADAPAPAGASWGSQGIIAFTATGESVMEVSESGGTPQPLTHREKGETDHMWPAFLPGSKAIVFENSGLGVAVQTVGTGERRNLIQGQELAMPRYVPSGHLIYWQAGNLMAVPFDPQRLEVKGTGLPVVQNVLQGEVPGASQYSVSATGSLVYLSGSSQVLELVWVSRSGTEQPLSAPARSYGFPRLSPDGRRIAVASGDQIWLYDTARDTLTRFTFEGSNGYPTWTPDGKRIAFMSRKEGPVNIFWQLADGSGRPERLTTSEHLQVPLSWSPNGQLLAFADVAPTTAADIWVLQLSDRKAQPFLETPAYESAPQFSPDGHWMAYVSDESGRVEVYVQPYPGPGGKWQISTDGGNEPVWNHNGRELFYRSGRKMMAVDISTQTSFVAGKPRMLFEGPYLPTSLTFPDYDVSLDGQRFLMLKPVEQEQAAPTQINVVLNWTEELKRLVPTGK